MSKRPASQELEHDPILARRFSHFKITSHGDLQPAQEFALAILENRKLAQYVRQVTLNYRHWGGFPAKPFPCTATAEAELEKESTFRAAIAAQQWGEEDATELLRRLMTTTSPGFNQRSSHQLFPDAVVALLLPILPNVQKWSVGDICGPQYVEKVVQRAKDGIFGSISVTHLELIPDTRHSDAAWADYNFSAFKIFQNLPFLQSIMGKGIGGMEIEDGGRYHDIPSKASTLREIHLRDCELSGQCLSKIIGFSTGLRSFTYRFGGRSGDGGTGSLWSPQLAKALTPHRLSMQSLDIDIDSLIHQRLAQELQAWEQNLKDDSETEEGDNSDSNAETLGSADGLVVVKKAENHIKALESDPYFPNLTHLRIGRKLVSRLVKLSGKKSLAEWLPASLEELVLVGHRPQASGTSRDKQVVEVIERRETLLPNLKMFQGIEEYIENGEELENEDDYAASDASAEETM